MFKKDFKKMFYYIQKNLPVSYIGFKEELQKTSYKISEKYEDFEKGFYIILTDEQVSFAKENTDATPFEIFQMELTSVESEISLPFVKEIKINEISKYDESNAVNNFKINGVINAWFTVSERNNYSASINAAKTVGLEKLTFFVGDIKLEISTAMAELMLAQIQLYADQCFIVTKQHKINVEALTTIEEVENYDYKVGYPEQLNFQLG